MLPISLRDSPAKGERPCVSHVERRFDHFWATRSGEPSSVKLFVGDDIRSCNFRPDKPEESVLKQRWRRWSHKHLRRKSHSCTYNLELHEGMSVWTGGSRGTKSGLPIAERLVLILVLEKPVCYFQPDEI